MDEKTWCAWCVNPLKYQKEHPECYRHVKEYMAELKEKDDRIKKLTGALALYQPASKDRTIEVWKMNSRWMKIKTSYGSFTSDMKTNLTVTVTRKEEALSQPAPKEKIKPDCCADMGICNCDSGPLGKEKI